jgi:hypothetical protein
MKTEAEIKQKIKNVEYFIGVAKKADMKTEWYFLKGLEAALKWIDIG